MNFYPQLFYQQRPQSCKTIKEKLQIIDIEVCQNCKEHQYCTSHDENKYNSIFNECKSYIESFNPGIIVLKNRKIKRWSTLGAFEIRGNGILIYSKLKTRLWPSANAVATRVKKFKELYDKGLDVSFFANIQEIKLSPNGRPATAQYPRRDIYLWQSQQDQKLPNQYQKYCTLFEEFADNREIQNNSNDQEIGKQLAMMLANNVQNYETKPTDSQVKQKEQINIPDQQQQQIKQQKNLEENKICEATKPTKQQISEKEQISINDQKNKNQQKSQAIQFKTVEEDKTNNQKKQTQIDTKQNSNDEEIGMQLAMMLANNVQNYETKPTEPQIKQIEKINIQDQKVSNQLQYQMKQLEENKKKYQKNQAQIQANNVQKYETKPTDSQVKQKEQIPEEKVTNQQQEITIQSKNQVEAKEKTKPTVEQKKQIKSIDKDQKELTRIDDQKVRNQQQEITMQSTNTVGAKEKNEPTEPQISLKKNVAKKNNKNSQKKANQPTESEV